MARPAASGAIGITTMGLVMSSGPFGSSSQESKRYSSSLTLTKKRLNSIWIIILKSDCRLRHGFQA